MFYINKYWPIFLVSSTGLCYLIGYLKAAGLFRAIYLMAIPTEIYSPSTLFVSGATFLITAVITPLIIIVSIYMTNYLFYNLEPNRVQKVFKPALRRFFFSSVLSFAVIFIIAIYVPSGFAVIPLWPLINSVKGNIASFILEAIIFMISAGFFWAMQRKIDKKSKIVLVSLTAIWFIGMFSIQIWALKSIRNQDSFMLSLIAQHPGQIGEIITKDRISTSSSVMENEYQTSGILLSKDDSTYYFAAFPIHPANCSTMYILSRDKAHFSVPILFYND